MKRRGTGARKAETYRGARRNVMRVAGQLRYWKLPENQQARLPGVKFYLGQPPSKFDFQEENINYIMDARKA